MAMKRLLFGLMSLVLPTFGQRLPPAFTTGTVVRNRGVFSFSATGALPVTTSGTGFHGEGQIPITIPDNQSLMITFVGVRCARTPNVEAVLVSVTISTQENQPGTYAALVPSTTDKLGPLSSAPVEFGLAGLPVFTGPSAAFVASANTAIPVLHGE